MKKLLSLCLALVLLCGLVPTAALAANKTFTLMVYLCGTDLESQGGFATTDLMEMVKSNVPEGGDLTVYIQTGGTKSWQAKGLTNKKVERWILTSKGIQLVESVGTADMGSPATLSDFVVSGLKSYPADRYGLILWDHGSGASGGVCYDEMSRDSLYMSEIYSAFETISRAKNYKKFAFVGFDACLMATYEMACHLQPFADYMIASEEAEPGNGWSYNGWLPQLAKNPGLSMETLGQAIVDSFVQASTSSNPSEYATLSVVDLTKMDGVRTALEAMALSLTGEIDGGNLKGISRARQNMRSFGEIFSSASDMIDIALFADAYSQYDKTNAKKLKTALSKAVVYSRHSSNLTNISGLSVLVPYSTRSSASTYMKYYDAYNLSPNYTAFAKSMVSAMGSGSYSFGSTQVQPQSIQEAQIDWFSQYATNEDDYYSSAGSLLDLLFGIGSSSSPDTSSDSLTVQTTPEPQQSTSYTDTDFSLDSFLSSLFGGDSSASFNTQYDDSASSLWGGLDEDAAQDLTSAGQAGSSFFSSLWGDDTQASPATDSTVNVQTDEGTMTLNNPFADSNSDYAYTLSLTQDELNHLAKVEANLMMDMSDPDFECYVELGYVQDVIVDWNRGKVYGLFDGTWPTLDGQMVCIYDQIANDHYVRSLIPVTLNGKAQYLLVVFDQNNPKGHVVGATEGYTEDGLPARGYTELKKGDVIIPQYELIYWDANDTQQVEPFEGDPIKVGKSGMVTFGYEAVEPDANYRYGFCLTDIYGDFQFTDFADLAF